MINLFLKFLWSSISDKVNSVITIILLSVNILFPLAISFLLMRNVKRLEEKATENAIGSLYEDVRTYRGRMTMLFTAIKIFRDLLTAVVLIYLTDYPAY